MNVTTNDTALRIEAVREKVTIFEVLERMGVDIAPETQQMRCPFHADRSPSARVYAEQNKIYCFTCQKSWDVIDAVAEHFKLGFADALVWVEREFGIGGVLPSLTGAVRMALLKRATPNVAEIAVTLEQRLKDRRGQLGFERYTKCLLALDLTVYEATQGTLKPVQLQPRLDAIIRAACSTS